MRQISLDFPIASSYQADDYLIAECNSAAWTRLSDVDTWPQLGLVLRGPAASGKTHLAMIWARAVNAMVIPASALSSKIDPESHYHGRVALLVEDIHTLTDQNALFHLLNFQREHPTHQLLLTVDESACWDYFTLPDLRSRLQALPQAAVSEPDDALIRALIIKQFSDYQREVAAAVVDYIALRVDRSFKGVANCCMQLEKRANEKKMPVTLALAREMLTEC